MTHLVTLFFATFSAAFMATVPPGLLNMNAAKTSVEKGKLNGIIFSIGVSITVIIQAYIAVVISKFLHKNPEVVSVLLKVALVVFAVLGVYFFAMAKEWIKPKKKVKPKISKRNSFYKGVFLAAINLLTIPYYSGMNAMWKASGWIKFEVWDILTFIFAAGFGTFAVLYLYTVYFNKLEKKSKGFSKNSNYIISALMLILFIITSVRVYHQ
ncbi:LysE family transporter [Cellulophaga sp. F20128]|uniref:LysE family transporter n=1 Tax=Cellulophaga sp. F20128 TaxID=2926413 RepID=UPI001FF2CD22|nr:LysE family transporter [Cellulophaga sp. F20128]MCK0158011.1 LysE family transporter [Cellulophaga sp. F20128]